MTRIAAASLQEQRLALRRRVQAQRTKIMCQLDPATAIDGNFPRSMTMRFLIQRSALAVKLLAGLATLLLGSRFFRSWHGVHGQPP